MAQIIDMSNYFTKKQNTNNSMQNDLDILYDLINKNTKKNYEIEKTIEIFKNRKTEKRATMQDFDNAIEFATSELQYRKSKIIPQENIHIKEDGIYYINCPTCNNIIKLKNELNFYCSKCGQNLVL